MRFFSFFFILNPPISVVHNLLNFFQIEWFKLLWNCHLKLYKSSDNSKGNRIVFKDCLRASKISYELFDWKFSVKTIPLLWMIITFLPLIRFCQLLQMRQEEASSYSLDTINNGGPSEQSTSEPYPKCWDTDLPTLGGGLHMFFQQKQRNNVWGFDWLLLLKCSCTGLVTNGHHEDTTNMTFGQKMRLYVFVIQFI
jgi:hypothetical protein